MDFIHFFVTRFKQQQMHNLAAISEHSKRIRDEPAPKRCVFKRELKISWTLNNTNSKRSCVYWDVHNFALNLQFSFNYILCSTFTEPTYACICTITLFLFSNHFPKFPCLIQLKILNMGKKPTRMGLNSSADVVDL